MRFGPFRAPRVEIYPSPLADQTLHSLLTFAYLCVVSWIWSTLQHLNTTCRDMQSRLVTLFSSQIDENLTGRNFLCWILVSVGCMYAHWSETSQYVYIGPCYPRSLPTLSPLSRTCTTFNSKTAVPNPFSVNISTILVILRWETSVDSLFHHVLTVSFWLWD